MSDLSGAPATLIIIVINFIVFIAETMSGGSRSTAVAMRFGAFSVDSMRRRQYWRLVTSMFVHFGAAHIIMNMYSLAVIGPSVEQFMGTGRFLIIYFTAGICGNLLTWLAESRKGSYTVSAGASGAIFGLLGVYVVLAMFPQTRPYISVYSLVMTLVLNLISGLTNRNVNMNAHLGGLLGGMAATLIMIAAL